MRVLVAPDSFGGSLTAWQAAKAMADGWSRSRPDDEVHLLPLSDGGEGLLEVVVRPIDVHVDVEVADPLGHPVKAGVLVRGDGTAIVESAQACGLHLLTEAERDPLRTTTYGVGQLIEAARQHEASRIFVGLGGSATVDAGAGALVGLGYRILDERGSGLKIGGGHLVHIASVDAGWAPDFTDIDVVALCDVTTTLVDAGEVFGPQKGADSDAVALLAQGLEHFAQMVERDLGAPRSLRDEPGSGAAGGLAYGLAAGLGGRLAVGFDEVAELIGLDEALENADLVVTGEGRLDATSRHGKVVGSLLDRAASLSVDIAAVVGQVAEGHPDIRVEAASPEGPGPQPEVDVADAAARLAASSG